MRTVGTFLVAAVAVRQALAQTAISQATFDNIIQYTRFARASYAANCAVPPNGSTVLQYFSDSATDAQATLFRWDGGRQIVLAFRGTSAPADWNTDLDFPGVSVTAPGASGCPGGCTIHEGFQKQYNAIAPAAIAAVKAALQSTGYLLVLTGHSLGGALASIATASFGGSGIKISATYTYGEPRNGNSNFGAYVIQQVGADNYYRVTHANDGVPGLPPAFLGYSHRGNEYWQKAADYTNTQATTVLCAPTFGTESSVCNQGQSSGSNPINNAHVTYSNDVIGNGLHIHDCGASYP